MSSDPYDRSSSNGSADPYDRAFEDPFAIGETDESADLGSASFGRPAASASSPFGSVAPAHTHAYGDDAPAAGPAATVSRMDLMSALAAPSMGLSGAMKTQPQESKYLSYARRGLLSQAAYNVGYSYLCGLVVGGAYGAALGARASPNMRPRVLLNSLLNGSGKMGARLGNAAGIMAMLYTGLERYYEEAELDRVPLLIARSLSLPPQTLTHTHTQAMIIPAAAAFSAGALFTLPRAISMRGLDKAYVSPLKRLGVVVTGGAVTCAGIAALALVGPFVFGHRSPFRFASS